jgi:hypothetical protein
VVKDQQLEALPHWEDSQQQGAAAEQFGAQQTLAEAVKAAAIYGNARLLRQMLAASEPDQAPDLARAAVQCALRTGKHRAIWPVAGPQLLRSCPDVCSLDHTARTAVIIAAAGAGDLSAVRALMASPCWQDLAGPALEAASEDGQAHIVRELITSQPALVRSRSGRDALALATQAGHLAVLSQFQEAAQASDADDKQQ